ncbi:MAG: hypothetical protein DMG32_00110 [Acidobacteria bacterium]|nr:MAG: hypothetical protein DMG32_00110 [Acidobacteriota bacterium]
MPTLDRPLHRPLGRWTRNFALAVGVSCALSIVAGAESKDTDKNAPKDMPVYKVDPFWPKPLPHHWLMQGVPVMVVDKDDHIWVMNRPRDVNPDEIGAASTPPRTDCCVAAPAVLEFDTEGNLLQGWGGPGYVPGWPAEGNPRPGAGAEHGILVDREGNVWISGSARGDTIMKFTGDGKLLWEFGHRGPRPKPGEAAQPVKQNNQDTDIFPTGIFFFDLDEDAKEIYIVDAKRVLVYDYDGKFKRGWGGHGIPLSEIDNDPTPPYDWKTGAPPDQKQFAPALHCVHFSTDGLVYVCERGSNRIQVFTKEGKFVSSFFVHPSTPSRGSECGGPGSTTFGMCGTTYNLTFSHDAGEKYVMIADGTNDKVWIHDRKTGELAGSIGDNGRMAGYFHWIDAIAIDSHGNLYTGEVDTGKRAQKFVLLNGDKAKRSRPHE